MRNGAVVEFTSGHVVECFEHDGREVSFKETSSVKWGAIGIIMNTHSGLPETNFIKYRIKIVWNNGKLDNTIIGANEDNIRKLPMKEKLEWCDFINDLEEISQTNSNPEVAAPPIDPTVKDGEG